MNHYQTSAQQGLLVIGSGPVFLSLVSALTGAGITGFHLCITDSAPTGRQRLAAWLNRVQSTVPAGKVVRVVRRKGAAGAWREVVRPYHTVLYAAQAEDPGELRLLQQACKEEKKALFPAVCLQQIGLAGPFVHPGSEGCWESAWRRLHHTAILKAAEPQFSSAAGSLLANVIVSVLAKHIAEVNESEAGHTFYLLDLETLEGSWHSFLPHPFAGGREDIAVESVPNLLQRLEESPGRGPANALFACFSQWTSEYSGIFHAWEEGDLRQLPLSQCRVQAADPLSEGPARLLPDIIRSGLTHEEARRESGLAGLEAYVSRLAEKLVGSQPFIGVGVGATVEEGILRGLQACLNEELGRQLRDRKPSAVRAQLGPVGDERCRYYLKSLRIMQGEPVLGLGEVYGFPVFWARMDRCWYGGVGLNTTLALRNALQTALMKLQNPPDWRPANAVELSSLQLNNEANIHVDITGFDESSHPEVLSEAMPILNRNGRYLLIADLAVEPFLKEAPGAVFGVSLSEEEPS